MTYVKGRECLIPRQSARETELFSVDLNIKVGKKKNRQKCDVLPTKLWMAEVDCSLL